MRALIFESEGPCVPKIVDIDNGLDCTVSFAVDRREEIFDNVDWLNSDYKFYVAKESFPFSKTNLWIPHYQSHFDCVFTTQMLLYLRHQMYGQDCVMNVDRIAYLPFATSWCEKIDDKDLAKKDFAMSFMPGGKFIPEFTGHHVRKQIYSALSQGLVSPPCDLTLFPPDKWVQRKEDIFDKFQFSIIVENYSSLGWFTEKLLDPFMRMTVPIYWGDTGIGNVFNPLGIISFTDGDEFTEALSSITPDTYNNMLPYIKENHDIAVKLSETTDDLHSFNKRMVDLGVKAINTISVNPGALRYI